MARLIKNSYRLWTAAARGFCWSVVHCLLIITEDLEMVLVCSGIVFSIDGPRCFNLRVIARVARQVVLVKPEGVLAWLKVAPVLDNLQHVLPIGFND